MRPTPKLIDLFTIYTKPEFLQDMHHSDFGLLQRIYQNKDIMSNNEDIIESINLLCKLGFVTENEHPNGLVRFLYPACISFKGLWVIFAMKHLLNEMHKEWAWEYYYFERARNE